MALNKGVRPRMDSVAPITHHADLISRLADGSKLELDRLSLPKSMGLGAASETIAFRFRHREVAFSGLVERAGDGAILRLTGDFGALPFSVQGRLRRQRALRVLAAANRENDLAWQLSAAHTILIKGEIALARPVTPSA